MSFAGPTATLALLLRIQLPQHTIRLCDGGEIDYAGERYASEDAVFGTVAEVDSYTSGSAEEAPAFDLTWSVSNPVSAVAFTQPEIQGASVQWRIVSLLRETNAVLTDRLIFAGIVDNAEILLDTGSHNLRMGISTEIDRLLNTDKGNRMNRSFHRRVWPGESGLDLMTGTTTPVPWGDKGRRFGGGGGGGGSGRTDVNFQHR